MPKPWIAKVVFRGPDVPSAWEQQAMRWQSPAQRVTCGCGLALGAMTPDDLSLMVKTHGKVCRSGPEAPRP